MFNISDTTVYVRLSYTYADNIALPAFAGRCCMQQLIDLLPTGPQQQAAAARCSSARMGQTDGYRFIDPAAHTMRAVPITHDRPYTVRCTTTLHCAYADT